MPPDSAPCTCRKPASPTIPPWRPRSRRRSPPRVARSECRAAFRRALDAPTGVRVDVSDGTWDVGAMVACAGLQADRVAAASGVETDIVIAPFRGEYYTLAPARQSLVRHLIYPVPDPRFPFLGVHFTRMAAGGVEAGPNAVIALAREGYGWGDVSMRDLADFARSRGARRFVRAHLGTGLAEIRRSFSKARFAATLARASSRPSPPTTCAPAAPACGRWRSRRRARWWTTSPSSNADGCCTC